MFTFDVTPDQGDAFQVEATSRDVFLWERVHKDNSLKRLESNLRMTDMYSLCHVAAKRQGKFEGSLSDFVDAHDIQPVTDDEEAAGPTNPGR